VVLSKFSPVSSLTNSTYLPIQFKIPPTSFASLGLSGFSLTFPD